MQDQADVTQLLLDWNAGRAEALDALMPRVYEKLRVLARNRLRYERPDHTLNTTALVHEAYLALVDVTRVDWRNRAHFLAMASRLMRRILVAHARRRNTAKRGHDRQETVLDEEVLMTGAHAETLLELDDALTRLEATYPRQCHALEHRYFGGLSNEETAEALGVSLATAERDLRFARAWLAREWSGNLSL